MGQIAELKQQLEIEDPIYSVSRLNYLIKLKLEGVPVFRLLYVAGETSDVRKMGNTVYFSLKEGNSLIKCVFFGYDQEFEVENGIYTVVLASVSAYEKLSEYQLLAKKLFLAGEGEHALRIRQLKKKLEKKGYFDPQNKKAIPENIQVLGLITAKGSAAFGDIVKTIKNRWPFITLVVSYATVQGESAADSIINSIKKLENTDCDLILLTRGGGSDNDLVIYNEEKLADAVFCSKKPIATAVGHDRDVHIADLVADTYFSTPTMAVTGLLPNIEELKSGLNYMKKGIDSASSNFFERLHRKKEIKTLYFAVIFLLITIIILFFWWIL